MIDHNKVRGEVVYRRTYSRPDESGLFEEWDNTVARVISHQQWLWERAKDSGLTEVEFEELESLKILLMSRKASLSGRTLWLGGTETSKKREASQFNCAGLSLKTINDAVDQIWLLMQGAGVGFHPEVGILNGFTKEIKEIEVIRSELTETATGVDGNVEYYKDGIWTIRVGDSAEAWAKAFGKLLAGKYAADKLVFDFSNIRPAGERLKGYGWISSGDSSLSIALVAIADILNENAGRLLTRINLLDIGNWMGTVLSSRRSAEIAFHRFGDPEWEEFATAKKDIDKTGNYHRYQSNNSLLFYDKPSKLELRGIFEMMVESGGSEPGFINAAEATRRAPWFRLLNPCLLGSTTVLKQVLNSAETVRIDSLKVGDVIWSKEGWTTVTHFFDRGIKQVNEYKTTAGRISLTPEHKIDYKGNKVEVGDSKGIDILPGPSIKKAELRTLDITEVVDIGEHNVYDITVSNSSHTFWADGFSVSNCAEILLGDSSFCNLVELNLSAFNGDIKGLAQAQHLIGRANYRQTCVNLKDGVLQDTWHELNEFLRLTGMGVTGIVDWEHVNSPEEWQLLKHCAVESVNSMADELGLPRSKAVTTIKPSGTLSKMMGCKEGIHQAMGKYIFNNIIFSAADPLIPKFKEAGYDMMIHPQDPESYVVTFPVLWEGAGFEEVEKGGKLLEVNTDTAVAQLERYKMVMQNYVDHNCSITVSYSVEEVRDIVDWLYENWDTYVGVSWLFRVDPTTTPEDIGYPYLPQEVKSKEEWFAYANKIKPFNFKNTSTFEEIKGTEECVGGVCPVK